MEWLNFNNILSGIVILLLLIDLVFRAGHKAALKETKSQDSFLHGTFKDFNGNFSFTRVSIAALILLIAVIIAVGWKWTHLQQYCTQAYDKLLELVKKDNNNRSAKGLQKKITRKLKKDITKKKGTKKRKGNT